MTRRREGQRGFGQVVLFGLLGPPETLLAPADRRAAGRRSAGGRGLAGAPPPLSPKRAARAAGDAGRGGVTAVGAQAPQGLELRAARVGSARQRRVPALLPPGQRHGARRQDPRPLGATPGGRPPPRGARTGGGRGG